MRQRVVTSIGPRYVKLTEFEKRECREGMAAALQVGGDLWSTIFAPDREFDNMSGLGILYPDWKGWVRGEFLHSKSISVTIDVDEEGRPTAYIVFKTFGGFPNAFLQIHYLKEGHPTLITLISRN